MLFIVRARRSQNAQQQRCGSVPPPCKQFSHRSPSQSAPGRPLASWPCADTGVETQSPAQKATTAAGLAYHMLSQQHQNTSATSAHLQPRCYRPRRLQDAGERSEPGVARANDTTPSRVSIGSQEGANNGAERRSLCQGLPLLARAHYRTRRVASAGRGETH